MIMQKVHLTTLYAIVVAIAPFLFWADNRVAHAEDVERTNAMLINEMQQISVTNRRSYNDIRFKLYDNNEDEKRLLIEERIILMKQQVELDKIRQEIK